MRFYTCIIFSLLLSFTSISAKEKETKAEKKIEKSHKKIGKEAYYKALKNQRKMAKKLDSANWSTDLKAEFHGINAYINLQLGLGSKCREHLQLAVKQINNLPDTFSSEEALHLENEILNTALKSGFYASVENLFNAYELEEDKIIYNQPEKVRNQILKGHILVNQGYTKNSEKLRATLNDIEKKIDESFKVKTDFKALSKKEKELAHNNYGLTILLEIKLLQIMGKQEEAITLAEEADKKFKKVFGNNSKWEGRLYEQIADLHIDLDHEKEARKWSEKGLKRLESELKEHSRELLFAELEASRYLALNRNDNKALLLMKKVQSSSEYYKKEKESNNLVPQYMNSMIDDLAKGRNREALFKAERLFNYMSRFDVDKLTLKEIKSLQKYFTQIGDYDYALKAAERIKTAIDSYSFESAPGKIEGEITLALFKLKYLYQQPDDKLLQADVINEVEKNYSKQHPNYFKIVELNYGAALFNNQLEKAKIYAKQILEITEAKYGKENERYLKALYRLGKCHINTGNLTDLEKLIDDYESASKKVKNQDLSTEVYLTFLEGSKYELLGDYDAAAKVYNKTFRKIKKSDRKGGIYVNLEPEVKAKVFIFTGDLDDAEDILSDALKQKKERYGEESVPLVNTYLTYSKLKLEQGNLPKAKEYAVNAEEILRKSKQSENSVQLLKAIALQANIDMIVGDRELALRKFNDLHEKESKIYGASHYKPAITNIKKSWMSYFVYGDLDKELKAVNKSLNTIEGKLGKKHPEYAFGTWMKAGLLLEKEDYENALAITDSAISVYESIDKKHNMLVNLWSLKGDVYYQWGKIDLAISEYENAKRRAEKNLPSEHPSLAELNFKIATSKLLNSDEKGMKDLEYAIEYREYFLANDFMFLTARERQKYFASISKELQYYPFAKITYDKGNKNHLEELMDHRMSTKGILLKSKTDFESQVRKLNDPELDILLKDWKDARNAYMAKVLDGENSEEAVNEQEALLKEAERLENILLQNLSGKEQKESEEFNDLQKELAGNEALIEIVRCIDERFNPYYYAIIATEKGTEIVNMPEAKKLESKNYKYLQNALRLEIDDKKSFKAYWEMIDEKIDDKINKVYFSPDGIYHLINPEMLKGKKDSLYLIDKYEIVRITNPKDVFTLKAKKDKRPAQLSSMLIGNPNFSLEKESSWDQLEGAEIEVKILNEALAKRGWEATLVANENATEDTLFSMETPGILHIATHGFFKQQEELIESDMGIRSLSGGNNPLINSGLLFVNGGHSYDKENGKINGNAEGIFTALEAQNLKLDNTDLVVLSACETGQGSVSVGNGVFGLQKSFLDAGAQNIMMTLQKVNDEVTQKLMQNFYEKYLDTNNAELALYQAKLEVKKEYNHPKYWAPFILVK